MLSSAAFTRRSVAVGLLCGLLSSCHQTPAEPSGRSLPAGRWIADGGACLAVTVEAADLVVGCGHGQFPRPALRRNGSFEIDGTYRIEAGPIGVNPAPPARFSGLLVESTLMLTVVPSPNVPTPRPLTLTPAPGASCTVRCL